MLDPHFAILSLVVGIGASLMYAVDTLRGRNRPNRVSWALWALAPMIAFAAELKNHVGFQSILTFTVGFGPFLVLVTSFFAKAERWHLTGFDYFCATLSVLAIILWIVTGKGDVAIIFSILADLCAAIPTLRKSFTHPESESWKPFVVSAVSAIITILTIKHWTISEASFAVYILIIDIVFAVLIATKIGKKVRA